MEKILSIIDPDDDDEVDYRLMKKSNSNGGISDSDDEREFNDNKDESIEESFIAKSNISGSKKNRIISDSEDDINDGDEDINIMEKSIRKAIRHSIYKVAHELTSNDDGELSSDDCDKEPEYRKNNASLDDDQKENVDHSPKYLDHGMIKISTNFQTKNHHRRKGSDRQADVDDEDSGNNTTNTSCDISYENKSHNQSKGGHNFTIKTEKDDSIDHDDSYKTYLSMGMSSHDNTKDESLINDEKSINQSETSQEIKDNSPPATDNKQKNPPKRSLTKPTTRSEIKKEIKRLTSEIERNKIFLMEGTVEHLPDKGKKVKKSIIHNENTIAEYKKLLEQMEEGNSSVASTDLSHNLSSDKENSLNDPNYNLHNSYSSPETNSAHPSIFDRKKLLKPTANTVTTGLGKQALATYHNEQALTVKRLEHLHGSLISQPSENEQVKTPKGLLVPLMPHQKHALAWLTWREKQMPPGGVLADDMGLGKTLTMISLVMITRADDSSDDENEEDDDTQSIKGQQCKYQGGTLVVCPASLIDQWKNEIDERCKRGVLSTEVYHGNNRETIPKRLARNDIVITTYDLLRGELKKKGQLYQIKWKRVILDEAHVIRNHKTQSCEAVCQLKAKKRWTLTGTPIHNKEMDIFAILKFLKCSPFDDIRVWKRWVENKSDSGVERLQVVMKSLMLRRTKKELITNGQMESLPSKSIRIIKIVLDKDERLVYDKVMMYSQSIFAQFLNQRAGSNSLIPLGMANKIKNSFNKAQHQLLRKHADVQSIDIIVLLLRLRQICCHPSLIHKMLDNHEMEIDEHNDGKKVKELQIDLVNELQNLNITGQSEEDEKVGVAKQISEHLLTSKNPVFHPERCSSKTTVILNLVREILDKREKLIIVSQWSGYLQIIGENLDKIPGASYKMFTGAVAIKNRQGIINSFNEERNPKILLLSLSAGGVGLNLVGANHLLLVNSHWNPQLESQAEDRIYRIGQKKNVFIYKLICDDTIEESIEKLQVEKKSLATSILRGKNKENSKLSVQDLMSIFNFQ